MVGAKTPVPLGRKPEKTKTKIFFPHSGYKPKMKGVNNITRLRFIDRPADAGGSKNQTTPVDRKSTSYLNASSIGHLGT